jgi:hypothetical protein
LLCFHVGEHLFDGTADEFAAVLREFAGSLVGALEEASGELDEDALFAESAGCGLAGAGYGHGESSGIEKYAYDNISNHDFLYIFNIYSSMNHTSQLSETRTWKPSCVWLHMTGRN